MLFPKLGKIINEIRNAMSDVSKEHCSLYADEMTYSGKVTPIHKTGLQKREIYFTICI